MKLPDVDGETKKALRQIEKIRLQLSQSEAISAEEDEKLRKISEHVGSKWNKARHPYPYPPHDHIHSIWVENTLDRLLLGPEGFKKGLSCDEIFLLLASVWLHDIGMIPDLFNDDKDPKSEEDMREWDEKVRNEHADRSARYINENCEDLGLTENKCDILMRMCKLHRHREY